MVKPKMFQYTLLLTAGILSLCVAEVFHVTPTLPAAQSCPSPCHTLDQYAQDTSLFAGHTNISLVFLEGLHNLSYRLVIVDGTIFRAHSEDKQQTVVLGIGDNIDFTIYGQSIILQELTFNRTKVIVQAITVQSSLPVLMTIKECDVIFARVTIGYSLTNEVKVEIADSHLDGGNDEEWGLFLLTPSSTAASGNLSLLVHNSIIVHYTSFGLFLSGASSSSISITDSMISDNSQGAYFDSIQTLVIDNSIISRNSEYGLLLFNRVATAINNSIIYENGIGISCVSCALNMNKTVIRRNQIGAILIGDYIGLNTSELSLTFMDQCTISSNSLIGLVLIWHYRQRPLVKDCTFSDNKGSLIVAYQSLFELSGESMFSNNSAERGAGLALYNSTVQFGSGSLTVFVNNTASEYGGAIYISSLPMLLPAVLISLENKRDTASQQALAAAITRQQCFYSIDPSGTFQIYFAGNSAILGGMDVFGSAVTLNNCGLAYSSYVQVTSDPTRVCFCADRIPQYTG